MEHFSLVCCETDISGKPQRAIQDPVLLNDKRVLANLLSTEDKYLPHTCYFNCVQTDIQPYMRKMVTEWMAEIAGYQYGRAAQDLEIPDRLHALLQHFDTAFAETAKLMAPHLCAMNVCSEQRMEEEVFPLSVNYLDRFLCIKDIKRTRLQLLGAACMFLASKLKETTPISGEQLVMYTDNSITLEELTDMESQILHLLKWDLSAIVPNDFLDHVLHRMNFNKSILATVKKQAQTFAAVCATDCKFMLTPPSMIACAAIGTAFRNLNYQSGTELLNLHKITGNDKDLIRDCMEQVEQTIQNCMSTHSQQNQTPTKQDSHKQEQPTTPTDVREINIMAVNTVHQAVPVTFG